MPWFNKCKRKCSKKNKKKEKIENEELKEYKELYPEIKTSLLGMPLTDKPTKVKICYYE